MAVKTTKKKLEGAPGDSVNGDLRHVLSTFGLNPNEADVYLALLELGTRPASVIAKRAKLKRANTYNVLASLSEKGIVQEFEKSGVRHFSCSPPRNLTALLEKREQELKQSKILLEKALPNLEKLQNPLSTPPKVRFYQGINGITELLAETLTEPRDTIYSFIDPSVFLTHSPELKKMFKDYIDARIKRGVWLHGIVPYSKEMESEVKRSGNKERGKRKIKLLENLDCPTETIIFGDKVAIVSVENVQIGILIEDKGVATSLRSIHQCLWALLEEY